jgi:putative tryptophan/tyrosine transport system substrate-binding protein
MKHEAVGVSKFREANLIPRKFLGLLLTTFLVVTVSIAQAQQQPKVPRIGYVSGSGDPKTSAPNVEAFRDGLRDLGYIEGKNIVVEYRYGVGKLDQVPSLVAEVVQLNPDVLLVETLTGIQAAKQATKTIPIVMVTTQDPVATKLIDSLAHPGGNITGLTTLTRELSGKRLELLKEVVPGISRVGVLLGNPGSVGNAPIKKEYEDSARALELPLQLLEVQGPTPDLEAAFKAGIKARVGALVVISGPLLNRYRKQSADIAIKNRLPSMHEGRENVEAGGLMSYAANSAESFRRAAVYVDKILKGTKPGNLPVEQPMKFEFIVNLRTAKQIGLTIPPNVLARADKVIK